MSSTHPVPMPSSRVDRVRVIGAVFAAWVVWAACYQVGLYGTEFVDWSSALLAHLVGFTLLAAGPGLRAPLKQYAIPLACVIGVVVTWRMLLLAWAV